MRKFEDLVKVFSRICKKLRIPHVIVGGVAVSAWGNIRTTRDIDVILDIKPEKMKDFVKEVKKHDLKTKEEDIIKALEEKSHFTIFDDKSIFYIYGKGVYNKNDFQTIDNRKKIKFDGIMIYVNSPEDLVANKLLFGSEQDIKDAESVLIRQWKKLNLKYLEKRCSDLKVYDKFLRIRKKLKKIFHSKKSKIYSLIPISYPWSGTLGREEKEELFYRS